VDLESLENNNDMLVFDFPELNDTVLSNFNNTSFSRVLRPRATTLDEENPATFQIIFLKPPFQNLKFALIDRGTRETL